MFAIGKSGWCKEKEGNSANSIDQRYGRTNPTFIVRWNSEGRWYLRGRWVERSPMVSYKFQTLGHNSFESPENLHSNRRRESKAHVTRGIESTFKSIIEDTVNQFQPKQGQGWVISNEIHNMGNPLST